MNITIKTHPNIALIKYWGKQNETLFLPTKSSLSYTLPFLTTTTTISVNKKNDTIILNGTQTNHPHITQFLTLFRNKYNVKDYFTITTTNNFPTAAGVASSSSGFAALARGLDRLYDLTLSDKELSILARQGSGSACRSIYKGFVLWNKGDHTSSYAAQLFPLEHWPEFRMIILIVTSHKKAISSRKCMQQTVHTSPYYPQWITESEKRIPLMIEAIKHKDLITVGTLAEQDALDMHHCIQTANPPTNYWQEETNQCINFIKKLRTNNIPCYFTIDAGPNIKIITTKEYEDIVIKKLKKSLSFLSILADSMT